MAKKLIIPKEKLPNTVTGQTYCYVRYRLISEDRNRFSAWTPIFSILPTVAINTQTSIASDDTFRLTLI